MLGEANFSDHGANRLGASALMQGLADGYFVLPYTIGNYFATTKQPKPSRQPCRIQESRSRRHELTKKLLSIKGKRTVNSFHRELGKLMWDKCGMARNDAGLKEALQAYSRAARGILEKRQRPRRKRRVEPEPRSTPDASPTSWNLANCSVLRRACIAANRAAAISATNFKPPEGEAQRDDENFAYVAAWEYAGPNKPPVLHKEPLVYEEVHMSQRSYK